MGMFKKQGAKLEEPAKPKEADTKEAKETKVPPTSSSSSGEATAPPSSNSSSKGVVFLAWGLPAAKTLAEAGITEVSNSLIRYEAGDPLILSISG